MSQTEQATTEKQKNLKIDRKIGLQMEKLIPKMQKLAENYNLADVREKSPVPQCAECCYRIWKWH